MNPLLIAGFGNSITVDHRRLVITNKLEKTKTEFYPHHIPHDSVILDGYTGYVTFEAMRWISKHNISLTLLNWNGELLSVTTPDQPKSGKLRVKQYAKHLDSSIRLQMAKQIIDCKIENSFRVLERLSAYYEFIDINLAKKIMHTERKIIQESVIEKIKYQDQQDQISLLLRRLMNFEGKIATAYLEEISKIFSHVCPEFHYSGRKNKSGNRNMNAASEINALFNYGYSILEAETRRAINMTGLDPTIGFLHEVSQSKLPLVYDIQELFRWIIDVSVIQVLEEKKLRKKDFLVTENYNTRLRENTSKILVEKIKNNFNTKVPYKRNRNHSFQNILLDNTQMLSNFISGKAKKLGFLIPDMPFENSLDFKKIKQDLIQMTPERRKELGINKSTLWYLKKNIESGKKPRIYKKVLEKLDTSFA